MQDMSMKGFKGPGYHVTLTQN